MADPDAPRPRPLRELAGNPYEIRIPSDADPADVVAGLDVDDHPAVLWGDWFGGGVIIFTRPLRQSTPVSAADAFALVDDQPQVPEVPGVVGGGWVSVLGYDRGTTAVAFYDHLLRWTSAGGWRIESLGLPDRAPAVDVAARDWSERLTTIPLRSATRVAPFALAESAPGARDRYLAAVEAVIGRIHRGDFYQLNLCTRLHSATDTAGPALFAQVADRLRPAYGALVAGPASTIISMSPELFLRVRGDAVETRPIKGTAPRLGNEPDSPALRASTKDAAENVMIVDLMRNDLSRVCRTGSVGVGDLLRIEPHPGVWHLVSTVQGRLAPGTPASALLAATFPPGSVTGAPKSAAQHGIADLEAEPRGAYTGSIGLLSPGAGTDLNVIIRSFELDTTGAEPTRPLALGVGGGITADSVPIREWYECLHKAAPLVRAAGSRLDPALADDPGPPDPHLLAGGVFETILVRAGDAVRLAAHLARLERACRELYAVGLPDDLARQVRTLAAEQSTDRARLRVTVRPGSRSALFVGLEAGALGPRLASCDLRLADRPLRTWRHKWQDRAGLDRAEATTAPALPYFVAADRPELVAETSRGNLFILDTSGRWCTPPLDEHVLPGVTRRELIDQLDHDHHPVQVRPITVTELRQCRGAFWTSSLSGTVAVRAVDDVVLPDLTELMIMLGMRLGFR